MVVNGGNNPQNHSYTTRSDLYVGSQGVLTMIKNSLRLVVCCFCVSVTVPVLADAPVKKAIHSDGRKRHRAIEESIGRMQLGDLIASIVDNDGKHPLQAQRASRATSRPGG